MVVWSSTSLSGGCKSKIFFSTINCHFFYHHFYHTLATFGRVWKLIGNLISLNFFVRLLWYFAFLFQVENTKKRYDFKEKMKMTHELMFRL